MDVFSRVIMPPDDLCSSPELGFLVEVDLREAWPNEATSFTPWLAANLGRLSEAVGIPLEAAGTEVSVDAFSADILATNPEDGSRVLIENQLERSDHGHLGQIMTYLAGLEAQTVIWVARRFTDAHLSAIRWLNQHTVEPFAFLAVQVRTVRIGDSAIAPLFETLERPNDWERSIQTISRQSAGSSELHTMWGEFWAHYLRRFAIEGESPARLSVRWLPVPGTGLYVSQYIANDRVGVFLRGDRGVPASQTAESLGVHSDVLAAQLGAEIGPGQRQSFFPARRVFATADRANWDEMCDWLHREGDRYVRIVAAVLGNGVV
jgi:hypothetical protein